MAGIIGRYGETAQKLAEKEPERAFCNARIHPVVITKSSKCPAVLRLNAQVSSVCVFASLIPLCFLHF